VSSRTRVWREAILATTAWVAFFVALAWVQRYRWRLRGVKAKTFLTFSAFGPELLLRSTKSLLQQFHMIEPRNLPDDLQACQQMCKRST
jgi:hypothetical protein